ncbi:DUF5683 domain-containing protein [Candidatus Kapabacteria bacterium]|nr:DUF5683 domain-containing protein [Candidatus Kapabacteria bacterium]
MQVIINIIILILAINNGLIAQSSSTFLNSEPSINEKSEKAIFGLEKNNTTNAIIFSIIPGGGQVYNKSYWKAGLLFGGGLALTANLIFNDNNFVKTRDLISSGDFTGTVLDNLKLEKEFYQDTRDRMGFFILVLYLVSTVDAYVGATLNVFDVDDNISFYSNTDSFSSKVGISFKIY